ncbi:MAG: hypothetical protein AABZ39_14990 [Spirochaetota bacterium]
MAACLCSQDFNDQFYHGRDAKGNFGKDLDFREKIARMHFEFGGGITAGGLDRPLYGNGTFNTVWVPAYSFDAFIGLRIIGPFFEDIEFGFGWHGNAKFQTNVAGVTRDLSLTNLYTLQFAYLIKYKFFQINKLENGPWSYLHMWLGLGPVVGVFSDATSVYTNAVFASNETYTALRFGWEAVLGGTFSMGESPLSAGFQVKYVRYLAAPFSGFMFSGGWDTQPQYIMLSVLVYFNFWDEK